MKTISVLLKVAKIGAIMAIVVGVVYKIVVGIYTFSNSFIPTDYSGAFYYKWRVDYVDSELLKHTFSNISRQTFKDNAFLNEYKENVQSFKFFKERNLENKYLPLYIFGLPDSFVLKPDSTWKVFRGDEPSLKSEVRFLRFRASLLSTIYYEKIKDKVAQIQEQVDKGQDVKFEKQLINKKYYDFIPKEDLDSFFDDTTKDAEYRSIKDDFLALVKQCSNDNYNITMKNGNVEIPAAFSESLLSILQKVLPEHKITEENLKNFFGRIMTIKPTALDLHILNRVYYYYFFCNLSSDPLKRNITSKKFEEFDKLVKELENEKDPSDIQKRRLEKYIEKREIARCTIIFNEFSGIIGRILGTKSATVEPSQDERSWDQKAFGLSLYSEPKIKKKEPESTQYLN